MEDYYEMAIILKLREIYKQKNNFDDYQIMGMKDFNWKSLEFQILLTCKGLIKLFHLDEDEILNARNIKYVIRILEEEIKNDHSGNRQQFVCQRVQELTEIAYLVVLSGDVAIHIIRQAGNDENAQRKPFPQRHRTHLT